jgi:hypothetical protein
MAEVVISTFKIGDFVYKFKQGKSINADLKARQLWGEVDYEHQSIVVRDDIPQLRQGQVLMHEIAHTILHEIGHPGYNDENLINVLGISLYQLLKENDFSFLLHGKKHPYGHGDGNGNVVEWDRSQAREGGSEEIEAAAETATAINNGDGHDPNWVKLGDSDTATIVKELISRSGVKEIQIEPYNPYQIRCSHVSVDDDGPVKILIVKEEPHPKGW